MIDIWRRSRRATRLPTFLIIGAMRAGTTTLWGHLRSHPDVFMPEPKELSFFTKEFNWHQGRDWYSRFFEQAGNAVAVGEASVHYSDASFFPGVAKRIARVVPTVRLVYLMRDPVERTVSDYYRRSAAEGERRPMDVPVLDPRLWSKSLYRIKSKPIFDTSISVRCYCSPLKIR